MLLVPDGDRLHSKVINVMPFAKNISLVGYHDLDNRPGFKLALQEREGRWYLYTAHLWDSGWTVLDVTDASSPKLENWVQGPPNTWTLQVQVAEGKMITSLEPIIPEWGNDPNGPTPEEGIIVWDVEDPIAPRELSRWRTGGDGTHRNYYDGGRYVHACAGFAGQSGRSYAVVDIADPKSPKTVGRWWWPGQDTESGESFSLADSSKVVSHHGGAYVEGDLAYCPWMGAGMVILNIADPRNPEFVGCLDVHPPLGSWLAMHSCVPVPGTNYVVVNSEAIEERNKEPVNFVGIADVSDPTNPSLISLLPSPRVPPHYPESGFHQKGGRFGPHNQHQPQNQSVLFSSNKYLFMTYFNAGLQVFDIEDPWDPHIVGYYIPEDPPTRLGPQPQELVTQCEDVLVDKRGFIYMTEKNSGLYILNFEPGSDE